MSGRRSILLGVCLSFDPYDIIYHARYIVFNIKYSSLKPGGGGDGDGDEDVGMNDCVQWSCVALIGLCLTFTNSTSLALDGSSDDVGLREGS